MEESKLWYQSKTVWGGVVMVGSAIAGAIGYTIDDATQEQILTLIMSGVALASGVWTIFSRVKATKTIGK